MPSLPRLAQHPNSTASFRPAPPTITQPPPPPAALPPHGARLSSDSTINVAFGVFMAVLGLITIYQAARVAALQARRYFNADQPNVQDVEMNARVNVNARTAAAEDVPQERDRQQCG